MNEERLTLLAIKEDITIAREFHLEKCKGIDFLGRHCDLCDFSEFKIYLVMSHDKLKQPDGVWKYISHSVVFFLFIRNNL